MRHRICWAIGNVTGHGDWFDDVAALASWVGHANAAYGAHTHWIESEVTP